ncbi:carbohydrate ABC transporter permease [Nocardioides mangrovi]|uniref:Sugar ABC transporter permease n=1 Tax=Nocardioides mangrovi TaxID=2874580 RepID=A0ABS7UK42_9ACTN|nr:sugar ABC transporter permease [Nocardioides mangrovi]MBZ5740967.1 sugar ABC transporter permease [Nocardioides mangrovi]
MTLLAHERATSSEVEASGSRRTAGSWRPRAGHFFVLPYVSLLVLFGIIPVLYSVYLAFTDVDGAFAGFSNFTRTASDYRFWPAVGHVAVYLVIWLVSLTVLVVSLTLMVHQIASRRTKTFIRFAYYIPGALAGASSVLLWLFVLDPTVSPVAPILKLIAGDHFAEVIAPSHLPWIFAVIAFWTGAGGWVLVLYGALNTIPSDVIEAARVDGASPVRIALSIQLPMIRKSITYVLILAFAAGTQLFVEPQLISQASFGVVPNDYSVNQLAYQFAFTQNDFNGSAAIALDLLVVSLITTSLFVARGRLFDTD